MLSRGKGYAQLNDEELVALARQDRQAFGEIYERYVDKVYSFVYYRTKNQSEAQDIVSATFLKALDHIGNFRSRGGGLGAWLFRIAYNLTMDHFRHIQKLMPLADETLPAKEASPEQQAVANDEAEGIRQLVDKLPVAQRELIILKFSLGFSNQEIAQIMGRSETAVSSLQYRALQNLKSGVKD